MTNTESPTRWTNADGTTVTITDRGGSGFHVHVIRSRGLVMIDCTFPSFERACLEGQWASGERADTGERGKLRYSDAIRNGLDGVIDR